MTALSTLAEIDETIARDEATLAGYREHLADREAEGKDATQARNLVRIVEQRLAQLRERRAVVEATEGPARHGRGGGQSR